jgi:hypothetical protein
MVGVTSSGSAADDDIETGTESETGSEAGSVADDLPVGANDDIEASDCELASPQCPICMDSLTNPVVYLLKL